MNTTTLLKTTTTSDHYNLLTVLSTEKVKRNSTPDSVEGLEEAGKWLWKLFSVVFLVFGLTGNLLTILVFRKIGVSKNPSICFLSVLAITDSVVLVTGLSRYRILNTFELDIRTLSDFSCKFHLFIIYVSMQYSSWILVFVCIERVIKTYFPLEFRCIVTCRRGYVSLIILLFVLSGVDLHFFWTNGINNFTNENRGSLTPKDRNFDEFVFVYIDFTFLSAVPFVIMVICNVLLVRTLNRKQRASAIMMHNVIFGRAQSITFKLTKVLLLRTFYFIVTTFVVSVYFIVDSYRRHQYDGEGDTYSMAVLDLVGTITYLMQYSNYSVNFYLYSMVNDKFCKKLKSMFMSQKLKPSSSGVLMVNGAIMGDDEEQEGSWCPKISGFRDNHPVRHYPSPSLSLPLRTRIKRQFIAISTTNSKTTPNSSSRSTAKTVESTTDVYTDFI